MSGDIGGGATRASIAFALRLAAAQGRPNGLCGRAYLFHECCNLSLQTRLCPNHFLDISGFLQLAGGTNAHTVDGLRKVGLFRTSSSSSMVASLSHFISAYILVHFQFRFFLIFSFPFYKRTPKTKN